MAIKRFDSMEDLIEFQHSYEGQLVQPGLLAQLCGVPRSVINQWMQESEMVAYAFQSDTGASYVLIPLEQPFLKHRLNKQKAKNPS